MGRKSGFRGTKVDIKSTLNRRICDRWYGVNMRFAYESVFRQKSVENRILFSVEVLAGNTDRKIIFRKITILFKSEQTSKPVSCAIRIKFCRLIAEIMADICKSKSKHMLLEESVFF